MKSGDRTQAHTLDTSDKTERIFEERFIPRLQHYTRKDCVFAILCSLSVILFRLGRCIDSVSLFESTRSNKVAVTPSAVLKWTSE